VEGWGDKAVRVLGNVHARDLAVLLSLPCRLTGAFPVFFSDPTCRGTPVYGHVDYELCTGRRAFHIHGCLSLQVETQETLTATPDGILCVTHSPTDISQDLYSDKDRERSKDTNTVKYSGVTSARDFL
jgi:hypothetical protein